MMCLIEATIRDPLVHAYYYVTNAYRLLFWKSHAVAYYVEAYRYAEQWLH
jgi:hypothetical protein